jgi:hypothetical protein
MKQTLTENVAVRIKFEFSVWIDKNYLEIWFFVKKIKKNLNEIQILYF